MYLANLRNRLRARDLRARQAILESGSGAPLVGALRCAASLEAESFAIQRPKVLKSEIFKSLATEQEVDHHKV